MIRLRQQTASHHAGYRSPKAQASMGIILLMACIFAAGCANKDTNAQAGTSAAKPTSAQEAAMRRGMQQGPAIAAAQRAHHGN